MTINGAQLDALTEIFNIGAGRAASSLSDIVGDEVLLSVPRIEFYRASDINANVLSLTSARKVCGVVKDFISDFVKVFSGTRKASRQLHQLAV